MVRAMAFASHGGVSPVHLHGQLEVFRTPIHRQSFQDARQGHFVGGVHQGVCHATAVCASCAPDAVDVIVRHAGHVEVDHDFRFGNVDATCTHIRADKHPNVAGTELSHGRQTRVLGFVGMNLRHLLGHGFFQGLSHALGILFGSDKQQCP